MNALSIHLGQEAARRIAKDGWTPELFSVLLGASGGPKWFILGHLDRLLFGDFLQRTEQPLALLGSSIGSWRHACLAMSDPVAAVNRMEAGYLYQHYDSAKPTAAQISAASIAILQSVLGPDGAKTLAQHPRLHTHIVTARGRGPAGSPSKALLAAGFGAAALGNTVNRKLLKHHFQRVVFHSGECAEPTFALDDFATAFSPLREDSVVRALHASGAIPFLLNGERDIPLAPRGQYWDGGIIDYHFDLAQYQGEGLILYPHFSSSVVVGWFDKFLPWRKGGTPDADKLVLLCPTPGFVASLPFGKIPDRSDFTALGTQERIHYWEQCVNASQALAEEFYQRLQSDDPLAGAIIHSQ